MRRYVELSILGIYLAASVGGCGAPFMVVPEYHKAQDRIQKIALYPYAYKGVRQITVSRHVILVRSCQQCWLELPQKFHTLPA